MDEREKYDSNGEALSLDEILDLYEKGDEESQKPRSPFKFLDSYGPGDVDIYFGRDFEIQEALWHFHRRKHFVLYGESG